MKFGPVPVADAVGAISAHSVVLEQVSLGRRRIKKGQTLDTGDVAALKDAQIDTIIVAQLEDGDIHEDAAASQLGFALLGGNVAAEAPFTGRVNLIAESDGVLFFDAKMLNRFNEIDESITCTTLAPFARVHAGQMVATIKIIPFSVEHKLLDKAIKTAGPISVSLFKPHRAGLVATSVPGGSDKVLD
ncbi:MAG: hypothetical protein K8F25_12095, partial [Fimbriimonadaceae bacterium]|nr:hypothetical protein [Alphaproteobacteria bacterium]